MNTPLKPVDPAESSIAASLFEVLIRAGLLLVLVMICFQVFSPFLILMIWAVILAVTLYPLHQILAGRMRGRQGLAATVIVLVGIVLIVTPTAILVNSLGDSVLQLIKDVQSNELKVPPPRANVAQWPLIGEKLHAAWSQAYSDLPAFVESMQPKIGELARKGLSFVAAIGGGLLMFLAAFIVSGILMAYGEKGGDSCRAIFDRVVGKERGEEFTQLSTATVRAVAQGVVGVAFIQAIVVGLCLLVAGVPWAGALSAIVMVLGVAQIPALLVTLPAIIYIWSSGSYGTGAAVAYSVLLFVAGMTDNVLKPLMLGRGVEAPMPVILLGALGGMATAGILGMFVGATLLALGYQIFMGWVAIHPPGAGPAPKSAPPAEG